MSEQRIHNMYYLVDTRVSFLASRFSIDSLEALGDLKYRIIKGDNEIEFSIPDGLLLDENWEAFNDSVASACRELMQMNSPSGPRWCL